MRKLIFLLIFMILAASLFAGGSKESAAADGGGNDLDSWLKSAQLEKYAPAEDDWDAIEKAAKEEGTLVVYSNSSKVYEVCRSFYDEYGIKAIPNDIGTGDMFEKLTRLQASGVYDVDIIQTSGTATLYKEFVDYNKIYKYLPTDIYDVTLDAYKDEQLAILKLGGKCVIYNTEVYPDGSPVDSWWDLTRPEWSGRLIMKDPMLGGSDINLVAMFLNHADVMEEGYKAEFGEDIVLSEGSENAGYEFIKRLLDNKIVLTKGGDDVVLSVGAPGQKTPPIGITGPSKLKLKDEQTLYVDPIWDIEPFNMFMTQSAIGIPVFAKHPNAAKLYTRWIYGDDKGGNGFAPFNIPGTWPTRTDLPPVEGQKKLSDLKLWSEDATWLYSNVMRLRDFWIQNQ